ncbi:MAG: DUF302 domain-containing protein [Gammaproteobacteria bacterium]|nr:DUF302 domain-containing protein [Gammaproteobacteria bacterium]
MNRIRLSAAGFLLFYLINSQVLAEHSDGVVRVKSMHSVSVTIDKLESALKNKGMTIFKRVSHSAGAAKVGLELRPTELMIFGNPKVGSPLMQCQQLAALDLPQKALVYEDEKGQVWLAYNDPKYIANRHNVSGCDDVVNKIANALNNFSRAATQ